MLVSQTAGVGMWVPGMLVGQLAVVGRAVLCWLVKTTGVMLVGQNNWGRHGWLGR